MLHRALPGQRALLWVGDGDNALPRLGRCGQQPLLARDRLYSVRGLLLQDGFGIDWFCSGGLRHDKSVCVLSVAGYRGRPVLVCVARSVLVVFMGGASLKGEIVQGLWAAM